MAALECKTDVCAFLRTGAGKTMVAIIPALVESGRVTVAILPLKSLVSDFKRKLEGKVAFEHYTGDEKETVTGKHGLILVSADMYRTPRFQQRLGIIHDSRTVRRLVFDESHSGVTDVDFHPALQNLQEIRTIPAQVVLLSGTVPPASETALLNAFGITPNPTIIRMVTDRPELQYLLQDPCPSTKHLHAATIALVNKEMLLFSEEDRALVFVAFKEDGKEIAAQLGCDFYHGGKEVLDSNRQAMYEKWIEGRQKVMVCTSAFGAGNDYSHVRLVVHAGTPKQMIGYVQEVSRGGRDGQLAKCFIIHKYTKKPMQSKAADGSDHPGYKEIWRMLYNSNDCIRFLITSFVDGAGVRCGTVPGSPKCSRCLGKNVTQALGTLTHTTKPQ